uniref:Fucolectin tachylectin-4 pentraxin-1 domain-containing protein n=1 Tax=Erpetoichthys calabaricus TaxID=27687 RepID=A0A8C4XBU6_ERPCA
MLKVSGLFTPFIRKILRINVCWHLCKVTVPEMFDNFSLLFESMSTAVNAIDGNRDSNYHHGSCACTNVHNTPWWRVDLLANHKINMVVITNRGDCCPEQINEAEIRIGNSLENEGNNNPRCATITSIPLGVSTSYNCQGMEGRYVNVVIPGKTQHLTLCEVEVYGVPIDQYC